MSEPLETTAAFDDEALEAARIFFAHPVSFMMGAVASAGLPPADLPEVAFAGRSNVGKSSLINAVTGRTHLARASTAPGRTREINFFVCDETLRLVDLPGYGFAKVSREAKNKFQNLGRSYLRGRPNLKRAYLLIDSRHGLKDVTKEIMGIDLSKAQQSSDWGAAKLSADQVAYAASDVAHLHALRLRLDEMLVREGRDHLARACFEFLPHRALLDVAGWEDVDIFAHA